MAEVHFIRRGTIGKFIKLPIFLRSAASPRAFSFRAALYGFLPLSLAYRRLPSARSVAVGFRFWGGGLCEAHQPAVADFGGCICWSRYNYHEGLFELARIDYTSFPPPPSLVKSMCSCTGSRVTGQTGLEEWN